MKKSDKSSISSLEQYIETKEEKPIYRKAFIHKSYKGRCPPYSTNEVLELIGDKALDLVLYEQLYRSVEGNLTKVEMDNERQKKTSEKGLAAVFDYYDLEKFVKKPDDKMSMNRKVKHNIVESLAGAIFLEEGYEKAKDLLTKFILNPVKN